MGWFNRAKDISEEIVDAVQDYKSASDIGASIGKEAYRQGLGPGELSWSTVERIAQEQNLNLDKYSNRDVVTDHINDGWENAAYDEEEKAKPFWKRGW